MMMNLLPLLVILMLLIFVTSNPIEYDSFSSPDTYSSSKSDDQIEIDSEVDSFSGDISQRLYKRQIESDSPQLSLKEIIENIEDSLLDSALHASSIYGILTSDTITKPNNDTSSEKDIEHIVAKRADDDDDDNNSKTSEEKNDSETVLTHFKAREVPVSDDHLAHVAVDRVTVFVANPGFLPMIPSFDLHHSGVQHESIKEILEDAKNNSSSEEKDNTDSTTEHNVSEINSTSSETTKIPSKKTAEELKEAEEELKEKVAEVAAEPIILSARV